MAVEKEFAQATGRSDTKGLTDREALHAVLSKNENRYLVRLLCWVLSIEGLEAYILTPRDHADYVLLVEALRDPKPSHLDVVIGVRGPIAPAEMCNGLMVPILVFDQIYSFDRESLIKAIPRREGLSEEQFTAAAAELIDRVLQMTDNAGMNRSRALNYLVSRYHAIYHAVAEAFERNESLTSVEVRLSPLSQTREILDVIFSLTNRSTDVVSRQFVRVDVTEEFPFLVSKLSPYYSR